MTVTHGSANTVSGSGAFSTVYSATFRSPTRSYPSENISQDEGSARNGMGSHAYLLHPRECAIKISSAHADAQRFNEARILGLSRHPKVLRYARRLPSRLKSDRPKIDEGY